MHLEGQDTIPLIFNMGGVSRKQQDWKGRSAVWGHPSLTSHPLDFTVNSIHISQPAGLSFVKRSFLGPLGRLGPSMKLFSLAWSDASGMQKPQQVKAERIKGSKRWLFQKPKRVLSVPSLLFLQLVYTSMFSPWVSHSTWQRTTHASRLWLSLRLKPAGKPAAALWGWTWLQCTGWSREESTKVKRTKLLIRQCLIMWDPLWLSHGMVRS